VGGVKPETVTITVEETPDSVEAVVNLIIDVAKNFTPNQLDRDSSLLEVPHPLPYPHSIVQSVAAPVSRSSPTQTLCQTRT
jgi:hypothetical protein